MKNKLNTIGLAYRAGKTVVSLEKIFEFVKTKKVYIVYAASLSEASSANLMKNAKEYNYVVDTSFSQDELSHAIGIKGVKAIGLIDKGFYELMIK